MSRVGLYQHPDCGRHDTGWGHPEHQGRLRGVMDALHRALPRLQGHIDSIFAEPAAEDLPAIAHSQAHVAEVLDVCRVAKSEAKILGLDADTPVSPASLDAALAAIGCAVDAVDGVLSGRHDAAFCPVRPPGHHATRVRSMGFCLFNNVAVAARHALEHEGVERILIVDWDVHHGNGTQDIFYEDPDVFYLSMHQHPFYPGTGLADERGRGSGEGTILNIPLPAGLEAERYTSALLDGLDLALGEFEPSLLLISAGFDAGIDDPLGSFTLTQDDFALLTREVVARTRPYTGGRVVSVLEGGYNPAELGRNVVAHLCALAGIDYLDQPDTHRPEPEG
ncbi:MAG: histone deacetylase [Gemmatimonadota bacterium]|nr:histone deacetylase [Gemmatimonadota bacterium]